MERPLDYYENNTVGSLMLIRACVEQGVESFIFSSTAAVYGVTGTVSVTETAPMKPLNPYGHSKLMIEWMLQDVAHAHPIRYVALRYFNVAGVDPNRRAGQPDIQVPHLIKRAAQVAIGRADHLDIYGTDYPTHDGTAVRDYIHVCDLVDVHLLALDHLRNGGSSSVYNCGYGKGASVRDVISAFERVTGCNLPARNVGRRPGDAICVVADPSRLCETLGWRPRFNHLDTIVQSALEWEQSRLPNV
jgi:UDP-glucose 4-epimerase